MYHIIFLVTSPYLTVVMYYGLIMYGYCVYCNKRVFNTVGELRNVGSIAQTVSVGGKLEIQILFLDFLIIESVLQDKSFLSRKIVDIIIFGNLNCKFGSPILS